MVGGGKEKQLSLFDWFDRQEDLNSQTDGCSWGWKVHHPPILTDFLFFSFSKLPVCLNFLFYCLVFLFFFLYIFLFFFTPAAAAGASVVVFLYFLYISCEVEGGICVKSFLKNPIDFLCHWITVCWSNWIYFFLLKSSISLVSFQLPFVPIVDVKFACHLSHNDSNILFFYVKQIQTSNWDLNSTWTIVST